MKIWVSIAICGGLITEVRAFDSYEKANTYFDDHTKDLDEKTMQEQIEERTYICGEDLMYWIDETGRYTFEIQIQPIEIE